MSEIPEELRYTQSHEWVRQEGEGIVTVGITDHAQEQLGDLVFVELPEVGRELSIEEEFGVVESVKTASDLYAPLSGEVVEVNEELADAPELVNNDAYGDGWLLKLKLADEGELDTLLDSATYTGETVEDGE
ncbi:MAG: glycine cleavage system protein GcvH [Gammaproteobacteria bacterium]|nr:glycine cleavage system protein GcvH [Gammaproteobacteria bacterium]